MAMKPAREADVDPREFPDSCGPRVATTRSTAVLHAAS